MVRRASLASPLLELYWMEIVLLCTLADWHAKAFAHNALNVETLGCVELKTCALQVLLFALQPAPPFGPGLPVAPARTDRDAQRQSPFRNIAAGEPAHFIYLFEQQMSNKGKSNKGKIFVWRDANWRRLFIVLQ